MRLEHPVFKGPLDPRMVLTQIPTPENYRSYPGGSSLPEALDGWTVQEGNLGRNVDYGLVSSPLGFEDSPDAEIISSGHNSKGPHSVAMGRHGNYFLWGFAGDPRQMTESARRVFVNVIVYMSRFDGLRPLVKPKSESRDSAQLYVAYLRRYGSEAGIREWLKKQFPEELGLDPDALDRYYVQNLEYLHQVDDRLVADVDLKELKVSNRRLSFFDALQSRLAKDKKDALALRLLGRYLDEKEIGGSAGLHAWLEENRPYLFFSDLGGFRWFVDEYAKRRGKSHPEGQK